jgi:hypothetical protein
MNEGNNKTNSVKFTEIDSVPRDEEIQKREYWSSGQYLQVLSSFFEEIFHDQSNDWEIEFIIYDGQCSDMGKGFNNMNISMYKVKKDFPNTTTLISHIRINPDGEYVDYYEEGFNSSISGLKHIELSEMKIKPEDAIRISENNGGKEIREKHNNECYFTLYGGSNIENDNWDITYTDFDSSTMIFRLLVNYETGAYRLKDIPTLQEP